MLNEGTFLVDRYEILEKVGAGGMSDVYKAKDHILGRYVAIKVLKQEFSEDRNFVTKFRTEAQSAAGLEHPNIVNIYDVGSDDGLYYIVMEYVEGITLKTYIEKKGQLSFKESVSIAIQVARGIEAAHNKEIIHRDIKPQNIMISTEGKVKVTDFGIARAASSNTISADVMGSVHYASPEQARNGFVDARSDLYSLGIVMYEMITGRVPFDGDTTVAVAIQHLQEEIVPPSTYASNIPVSFEQIIMKCTLKNPDRRYQTIAELLADLRRSLVSPDEDFVVMTPLVDNSKTKIITDEDIKEIKDVSPAAMVGETASATMGNDADFDEEGDEDDDDLNPKFDKAITIMVIGVAALIVIILIYFIGAIAGIWGFGKVSKPNTETQTETQTESTEMVEMIDITGMSLEEAEEALKELGLSLFVVNFVESDEEDGTIVKQYVKENAQVAKGDSIKVDVAGSGEKVVPVPNVVGATETNAANALKDVNLKVEKQYEYSSDVEAGNVISQNPTAGSTAEEGATVTLVISQGKEDVKMPNVVGSGRESAVNTIEGLGLVVGTITEEYSDTVDEGKVISQSVVADKTVQPGTTVNLVVSLGKKVAATYKYNSTIQAALDNAGVTIPEGATGVKYTLTDATGEKRAYLYEVTDFSASVTATGIPTETGTLVVEFFKKTTSETEEGETKEEWVTISSTTIGVTFTQQ
ncbi:MAG: Stk1 family PASTA domain-containing Ser/Thr kinase [Agathobacter sp.]|nr:Stk1 family PASTA domain-containing Ser/Thr kinase [Agathobacter sp.]